MQRKLHRSVTEILRSLIGLLKASISTMFHYAINPTGVQVTLPVEDRVTLPVSSDLISYQVHEPAPATSGRFLGHSADYLWTFRGGCVANRAKTHNRSHPPDGFSHGPAGGNCACRQSSPAAANEPIPITRTSTQLILELSRQHFSRPGATEAASKPAPVAPLGGQGTHACVHRS